MNLSDLPRRSPEEKTQDEADMMNRTEGREHEKDGYECGECLNRGYSYFANGIYVVRRDCKCQTARRSIRRMQKSGLGKLIHKYTFQRYQALEDWQKRIKRTAQDFLADDHSKWFYIGGASGAGKSHICTAICRNLLTAQEAYYMMWESECPELKGIVTDAEAYQQRVNRLKEIDVLYIDDFFSGRKMRGNEVILPTAADVRLAREILNHRYVEGKTTIISSEWYSTEVFEIDNALGGRIVEMCGPACLNVKRCESKNYRLKMGGAML